MFFHYSKREIWTYFIMALSHFSFQNKSHNFLLSKFILVDLVSLLSGTEQVWMTFLKSFVYVHVAG